MNIKKNLFLIVVLVLPSAICHLPSAFCQQTPQYTQFMLNNYGMNPAVCGMSGNKYEALAGIRRQWVGFENAPQTSFFNVNTYFGRRGGGISRGWHGVGAYWQGDRQGNIIKVDDFYASYTYLMRLARKGFMSFGVAVGARRYGLHINEASDPVLTSKNLWLYPDFIPGIKYFNNNWTFDLSVKQLYKYTASQGGDMIGSPSKLPPHFYFMASYKYWARSTLLLVQSVQVKYTFSSLPGLDYNLLAYLNKSFAVGASYRHLDAVALVAQYRLDKFVIGLAFDYAIAPYRVGFANSDEIMIGVSPSPFSGGGDDRHYKTAECPTFQY